MPEDRCRCARGLRHSCMPSARLGPGALPGRARGSPRAGKPWRRAWAVVWLVVVTCGAASTVHAALSSHGQMAPVNIAVALSLSGRSGNTGMEVLEGIRMAIEEAGPQALPVELVISDDQSSAEAARETARRIAASDVIAVMGPSLSTVALEVDPIYAEAGLAVIAPNVATDEQLAMYRLNLGLSRVGDALASYLYRAFDGRRAAVIHSDDGFGRPFALGFRRGAARLGITTTYHPVSDAEQIAAAAHRVAEDPERPAVVLGLLETAAVPALRVLKRADVPGPILGSPSFAYSGYARLFAEEAEERATPGFFTDGLYAASPVLFDSGSAAQLAFEQRYWARRGHEPSWRVVLAYDATRVLLDVLATALRQADGGGGLPDTAARRRAVREALAALNSPARAHAGLSGPVWFDAERMRPAAIRIARFNRDVLESAPLQLTPVLVPDVAELASGAVFEVGAGRYKRLQRVVNTGIFINEIPRLDLARSSFSADFYLWMRFARDARPGADDPTDISFPTLLSGTFDRTRLAAQRTLNDGTEYRLWHVQGEFRNDFDLHRFPFDTQTLSLSFFNTRADMDRIVYVLDKSAAVNARHLTPPPPRSPGHAMAATPGPGASVGEGLAVASATAFRHLSQWHLLSARPRRENLVTASALGDPTRIGVQSSRELSGFVATVELQRRIFPTLAKTLMPLLLMTLIMYASLYFPKALVNQKVTVAITGALSGAVLLSAINSQLGGNIGYTLAVEYAFYVYFGLSLLCILSVLGAEHLRATDRGALASQTERWTRLVFLMTLGVMVAGIIGLAWSQ